VITGGRRNGGRPDFSALVGNVVQREQKRLKREPAIESAFAREATPVPPSAQLAVADLRFHPEQQPRDMLPDEAWDRLVAAGTNAPADCLGALRLAAEPHDGSPARSGSLRVLDHVLELAESIRSEGVLVPLTVVDRDGQRLVLDGHCRAMACVIAGLAEAPVRIEAREAAGDESDLADATHRFVLNWTQEKLSPLEAARQVQRIVEIAIRVVDAKAEGGDGATSGDVPGEAVGWAADVVIPDGKLRPGQTQAQALDAAVRKLVLGRTGLSQSQYYVLRQIHGLSPDAWEAADGLSEAHLRAIVTAPGDLQCLLAQLVRAANASVKETRAYCRAAREQGEEYIQRKLDELLGRSEEPLRRRTAVSWEPLLRAIPEDLTPRLSALRAELAALDEVRRKVRLRSIVRQRDLLVEATRAFEDIMVLYGLRPESPSGNASGTDGATAE
jgi:ParB-like nuclease domain